MDTENKERLQTVPDVRMVARPLMMALRPLIHTSASANDVLRSHFEEEMDTREAFRVLMLDRGNRAKCIYTASIGGLHGTVADPKLIFCAALKCLASAILIAHNHPSGQLRPSQEDISLTKKLVDGGRLLDIVIHDHLILGREGYFSFQDNGMM